MKSRKNPKLYCLRSPDGTLFYETINMNKRSIEDGYAEDMMMFDSNAEFDDCETDDELLRKAKKLGWKVVRIEIIEKK